MTEKKMKGYIYILKNKVNEKFYIGSTFRDPAFRFVCHCSYARSGKKCDDQTTKSLLYKTMAETGVDNWYYEILEEVFQEDSPKGKSLREIEGEYIVNLKANVPECGGLNKKLSYSKHDPISNLVGVSNREYMKKYMTDYNKTDKRKQQIADYKKTDAFKQSYHKSYEKKKAMKEEMKRLLAIQI
jgi:hypothetical protein